MKPSNQNAVPSGMQERFDAVMCIVDSFCRTHLNEEYAALCRRMAATLCRKRPSPLMGGTARVWACAIVYSAGRVNFLEATSNSVERGNRRHRKMQKSIYRVRTQKSLIARMALDLFRDKERVQSTALSMAMLHVRRTPFNVGMEGFARRSC